MSIFNKGVKEAEVAVPRNPDIGDPEGGGEELPTNTGVNAEVADLHESGVKAPEVAEPEDMSDYEFDRYIENIMGGFSENEDSESIPKEEPETKGGESTENTEDAVQKPFRAFNSQEEYQAEIDRIISKRHNDYNDVIARNTELVGMLKDFYGVDGESEAVELFKNQVSSMKAEEVGMSAEEYEREQENRRKIEAYDRGEEEKRKLAELQARIAAEEANIREADKEFDLKKAYNNDELFKKDLDSTGSVYLAYSRAVQRRAAKPEPKKQPTERKPSRFSEEGIYPRRNGEVSTSPASLSDAEFDAYIKRIEEGS